MSIIHKRARKEESWRERERNSPNKGESGDPIPPGGGGKYIGDTAKKKKKQAWPKDTHPSKPSKSELSDRGEMR